MKKRTQLGVLFGLVLLFACQSPMSYRQSIGNANHDDTSNVGSSGGGSGNGSAGGSGSTETVLVPPQEFFIVNNKTATQAYLTLKWKTVQGAKKYRVYRAVYPTHTYQSNLDSRAYKLLKEVTPYGWGTIDYLTYNYYIPYVPLRRYSFYVTAVNDTGESNFAGPVVGYRMPMDEKEALQDMDYTIHFAQSAINNFGAQGLQADVQGRGSGTYHYASKWNYQASRFTNYADFETVLNGAPGMKVSLIPQGVYMNGTITASGLYSAKLTYHDLFGVVGGYSTKGSVTIEYDHPTRGTLKRTYSFNEAKNQMKTIASTASEKQSRPPESEWNEASHFYNR